MNKHQKEYQALRRSLLQLGLGAVYVAGLAGAPAVFSQESTTPFTQVVTQRLLPGKEDAGIALYTEMMRVSGNQTPELLMSILGRGVNEPAILKGFEVFASTDAAMRNGGSPALMRMYPRLPEVYEKRNDFLRLVRIGGFSRMPADTRASEQQVNLTSRTIRAGSRDAALALVAELVAAHETQAVGPLLSLYHQDENNPDVIFAFEIFENAAAAEALKSAPYMTDLEIRLQEIFDEPETTSMRLIDAFIRNP